MRKKYPRLPLVLALVVVLSAGTVAFAWPFFPFPVPRPVPQPCPNWDLICLDVWDPVTCDDGVTYSNQCYADRACATGCVEGYPTQ